MDDADELTTARTPEDGIDSSATGDDAGEPVAEISYDEQRYPARPRRLRPRDQFRGGTLRRFLTDPRNANGANPSYVEWLVRQSMLKDADVLSRQLSGQPSMWRNPYARPDARRAIESTDVWFTTKSTMTRMPSASARFINATKSPSEPCLGSML